MAVTTKFLASLFLFVMTAAAVQACTPQCGGCNAFGPYWSGQGCGKGSYQVFSKQLKGSDDVPCCQVCAKDKCCLFWVWNPKTSVCNGFSHCERSDYQPTVREWLGDWKVLPKSCPGWVQYPDAQIDYPGMHKEGENWPVGQNPPV